MDTRVYCGFTTTEFLSALVITNACLQYLLSLTCSLQAEANDIVEAVAEVKHVITALEELRENVVVHHRKWFAKVEQLCDSVGVQAALPRLCARQRNRANVPAENACDYYRRVISIPLLDHLITDDSATTNSPEAWRSRFGGGSSSRWMICSQKMQDGILPSTRERRKLKVLRLQRH